MARCSRHGGIKKIEFIFNGLNWLTGQPVNLFYSALKDNLRITFHFYQKNLWHIYCTKSKINDSDFISCLFCVIFLKIRGEKLYTGVIKV